MISEKKQKIDINKGKNLATESTVIGPWKIMWKRLRRNKLAMLGLIVITIMAIAAIFAPFLTPYGRDAVNLVNSNAKPGSEHLLGTDSLGRDIFTRLLYGGRISLTVGFVSTGIRIVLGVLLGGIAGYYGKSVDNVIMRVADVFACLPFLPIAITIVAMLKPSIYNIMLVIGVLGWPGIARIVRAEILSLREREFMEAATALGISDFRKIVAHLLPNTMASVIVSATIGIAGAILTESSLSFLGLGVAPPIPSWGNMLTDAKSQYVLKYRWWQWIPPGLAIFVTVMSLNLLGDGLRDALDPRLKQ
ncbi:oligopeptide ABC transporter permease [Alkaliphilus sp. B6464]|uniref:oligopeptide ABC transporter permease n=1 Tax=Alkaliphilus sp. B6464 TaxID=2731219 RepID=UPI001BAB3D6D|nr:oligopeptide ABC transporter permease [Alkaliphilus sp. B6464]QUH20989.1 ABC transporter permease [Alkaliphilus sp. B6464]